MSNLIGPSSNIPGASPEPIGINTPFNPGAVQADDEINLGELLNALRRRRKWVGLTAAAVLVLAGVNTAYQRLFRPVYQGSFSLLITDPISDEGGARGNAAAASGTVFEQLARNTTQNDIPTLIEVLQSPLLLEPIAQRFDLSSSALAGRISISTGGAKRREAEGVLKVSLTGRNPKADTKLLEAISDTYLQAALQQRQQRLADGLNFLNKQAPELQQKTEAIQAELAAFRRQNSLLEPTTEGGALKQREEMVMDQILGLEAERSRLQRVRQEIESGTLSARGFQEAIGTGSGGRYPGQNQGLSVSDADQSLLQQLVQVETQLADARSRYRADSSTVRGLEARLNQLQPLLQANQLEAVDAALSLNAGRIATARQQEQALNRQFLRQPALIKQYDAIQTRLKVAQDNLSGLVRASETFQLEIAQQSVPWRVIAPPTIDPNPVKPSVPRNLALGALLGVVAGIGVGLLRDRLDHVFHDPGDVQSELKLPLLGHVPHVAFFKSVREDKRFLLKELDQSVQPAAEGEQPLDASARKQYSYQRFFYQEAFRNLFTSIRFLNSDQPLRSIALTSSLPSEGKTLVNALLAKTLSEMGQRVLLIDADLRKPQVHVRLGLNTLRGLSNLLSDDDSDWRRVLQSVDGYEGWSVITAGRRPPDPTRLLSSRRMHRLVEELQASGEFDLVLFDTPPALGLADASLVAEHCDGMMLLVSLDRVDRGLPREAVSRLRVSGVPLLGVVTNAVKQDQLGGAALSYGRLGYGKYRYGYGGYSGYNSYSAAIYANYANDPDVINADRVDVDQNDTGLRAAIGAKAQPATRIERWRERTRRFIRWIDS